MTRYVFPIDLFDGWMDEAFKDLDRLWDGAVTPFPPADVLVNKDTGEMTLRLAVAGYDQDKISVTTEDSSIIIEGESSKLDEKYSVVSKGIKGSSFKSRYPMSPKFDLSKVEASYKEGILELKIPLAEEKKPKKITILR